MQTRLRQLTVIAERLIRRFRIRHLVEADDVANTAMLRLWRNHSYELQERSANDPEFNKLATLFVKRTILYEVRRMRTLKRGGLISNSRNLLNSPYPHPTIEPTQAKQALPQRLDLQLIQEFLVDRSEPPEHYAILRDEIASISIKFAAPDFGRVLELKLAGLTIGEIADATHQSKRKIERIFQKLREVFDKN